MNLANITHETLSRQLDKEVPEVFVVIAKHAVAGMDLESIADIIGCELDDVQQIEHDSIYKEVRLIVGSLVAGSHADQPMIWDSIESIAGRRLLDRIEHERDPEFLLKAAATANRMHRRSRSHEAVLDPSRGNGKAAVVLTSRMIERITQAGHRQVLTERTISISDGSMVNPSFEEINQALGVRPGLVPNQINVQPENALMDELDSVMKEKFG